VAGLLAKGPLHAPGRRLADVTLVLLLAPLALPLAALLAAAVRLIDGAPVLHVAERMRTPEQSFRLYKFRTMRRDARPTGVLGGDRAADVTRLGRFLRRSRLDELPQLWNVLRGDMAFVGPRPPERLYVERRPELYAEVLRRRPGLTGLATLVYHAHEERLLAACGSPEETDAVYMRRCVPRKARLDLIWQRRSTLCGDLGLLGSSFARVLRLPSRSRGRTGRRVT
jgi:lipopolysaccharide/colanic/teichoic acid biosynthesis glycosyltransferase